MKTLTKSTLIALLSLGWTLSAHAEEDKPKPSDDCLYLNVVQDWQPLDKTHIMVWAPGRNRRYLVQISTPLHSLRYANSMGFVDGNSDGYLCAHGGDAISIIERGLPQRIPIYSMSELDAESVAKLEEKYQTSLTRGWGKKKIPKEPESTAVQ